MKKIINELAELGAKHKLVPFLGAGCSIPHLSYGWDEIRDELKKHVDTHSEDHLKVAQKYIDKFGKNQFCEFLMDKLKIENFDDKKGYSYLAVMGWGVGVIYTTNQDNVMEKCLQKYGRKYTSIINLEDLSKTTPGDSVYIKFHGDLSSCKSVVFATDDYNERINDIFHFLNIRLRSDLLAKNIIFIGYSLRDKNIRLIFKELQNTFQGELPNAYMIAWEYSEELQEICDEYGVILIDPLNVFPEYDDNSKAFNKFLDELVYKILQNKTQKEIGDIFRPSIPPAQRVASYLEINALERIIDENNFKEGCEKFRAVLDQSLIPKDFEKQVVNMFWKLAQKCSNTNESDLLNGAAFNLKLSELENWFEILVALMATVNVRKKGGLFNLFLPSVKEIPEEIYIIAVAAAIEQVLNWDRGITDVFQQNISNWVERSIDYEKLDSETKKYVKKWIDKAWEFKTTLEHPISRQQRLKNTGFINKSVTPKMMNLIPKKFLKPYEE